MADLWGKLRVDVVDDEILVSLPGTTYSVIYFKREKSLSFPARNIPMTDDTHAPLAVGLLSRAWREANDKARELGLDRLKCFADSLPGRPIGAFLHQERDFARPSYF